MHASHVLKVMYWHNEEAEQISCGHHILETLHASPGMAKVCRMHTLHGGGHCRGGPWAARAGNPPEGWTIIRA